MQRRLGASRHRDPMTRRLVIAIAAACVLCNACGEPDSAVGSAGTVTVTVSDARGAPVSGASVTVSSTTPTGRTSFTKPTDVRGTVKFTQMKAGTVQAIAVADATQFGRSEQKVLSTDGRVELALVVRARP
jgi:hypothetical protein